MKPKRRVVITGIGPITSIGIGKDIFWKNLLDMNIEVEHIPTEFEQNFNYRSKYYVPFPQFEIEDFDIPKKYNKLLGPTARLAAVATQLALKDAGFNTQEKSLHPDGCPEDTGVLLGVGVGNLLETIKSYLAHNVKDSLEYVNSRSLPKRFNRMSVPTIMPNTASAWTSVLFGFKGENYTLNASCASGTFAIGNAYRKIQEGHSSAMLAGGLECLQDECGWCMRGFDVLGALTRSENGKPMPFSTERSGFLFSEGGGCILVLEEMNQARERNARILAEIVDYRANSDAYSIVQIEPDAPKIHQMIQHVVDQHQIDYFNTHGTATQLNDKIEAEVIQKIFGDRSTQPLINSSKGILGHTIGASGAIEAAITALSVYHGLVHGNLTRDPVDNLNIPLRNKEVDINYALSTSYGFGGHNAVLLLKKFNEN